MGKPLEFSRPFQRLYHGFHAKLYIAKNSYSMQPLAYLPLLVSSMSLDLFQNNYIGFP